MLFRAPMGLSILDRYIAKHVLVATLFIGVILSALVLLTQSLKFLELVINAGASGLSFWILTLLALPRFLEIVVPIGLMAGVLFVYNRLIVDSELIAMKGLGFSPITLARPALILSLILSLGLFIAMAWLIPLSTASMQEKRVALRAEMSNYLFREGVFNQAGKGLMVYVRERSKDGSLRGLIVHDARDPAHTPSTIIAAKGIVVTNGTGQQVIVYNGSRQDFDPIKSTLRRLNFDQYTIDLPADSEPTTLRWREPDERTLPELLRPNLNDAADVEGRAEFTLEIHKRFSTPFLVLSFSVIGLYFLLLGALDRRGATRRILMAVAAMIIVQILYMSIYNVSKQSPMMIPFMYLVASLPAVMGFVCLWQPRANKRGQP